MAKYIVNGYLIHQGKATGPDSEIELTAEQAKRLGDKVKAVQIEKQREKQPEKQTKTNKPKAEA